MDNQYSLTLNDGEWTLRNLKTGEVLCVFRGTKAEAIRHCAKHVIEWSPPESEGPGGDAGETGCERCS